MAIHITICGAAGCRLTRTGDSTSATKWPCRMCGRQKPLPVAIDMNGCFIARHLAVFLLGRLHRGQFFFKIVDALLHAADFRLHVADVEKSHILGGRVKRGTITNPR